MLSKWNLAKLYHSVTANTYLPALVLLVIFCVTSAVIPSNKIFFLLATAYFVGTVLITQSIYKALLLTFLPLSILNIGQVYITTIIPFNALSSDINYEGRQFFFRFSPFFVLQLTTIVLLILEFVRKKGVLHLTKVHLFAALAILSTLVSVLQTEHYPYFSFITVIDMTGRVAWLITLQMFLASLPKPELFKCLKTLFLVIVMMATLQSGVVAAQLVKRSTLNLRIEQSTVIPQFGAGADENALRFRPIGLDTHSNNLANTTLILLFSGSTLAVYLLIQKEKVPWQLFFFFVSELFLVILITLSRAAYISLFIGTLAFFIWQRKTTLNAIFFLRKQLQFLTPLFLLGVLFFVPLVTERLLYSVNSFGVGGGVSTRAELQKQAVTLLSKNFFFGVGPSMFIPAAFKDNPRGVIYYFPETVHNGFLLFLTERGFVTAVIMVLFVYLLIRQIVLSPLDKKLKTLLLAGFLTVFFNMLLHPFDNFFSFFTLVAWLIVYIQPEKSYEK